jgi:putative methionine-R-sulfoxide reductase with GAF domain
VSATGSASPVCILIQPLILNQTVLGVIELAAFRQFDENDKLILSELSLALAMSIELLSHREI